MLVFGFVSFFAFGLVLVLVGANQAELSRELSLSLARSGLLSASVSIGLGLGVVGAGPLFDRYPRRPLFVGSMLLAGAALLSVNEAMSFQRWLVHLAVAGFGIGAYGTLINGTVVQRFAERAALPMTALHAATALGAMLGPFLSGLFGGGAGWLASFHLAGAAHLALAGGCFLIALPTPDAQHPDDAGLSSALSPVLLPFALIAFAYVGIEAAMTVFAVPLARDLGSAESGAFSISAFWLGLLLGRLGMVGVRTGLDARVLMCCGVAGTIVLVLGTLLRPAPMELTFFATGLALGGVYPVMIALAGQAFPQARGTAAGLTAGAGALGGFGVPWLTGAIGDGLGVVAAVASLAFWAVLIAAAALVARRSG